MPRRNLSDEDAQALVLAALKGEVPVAELCRVVLPAALRQTLGIADTGELEIYVEGDRGRPTSGKKQVCSANESPCAR